MKVIDVHVRHETSRSKIQKAQRRWRAARTQFFDHDIAISWVRVVSSVITVLFLYSDVARSGMGIKRVPFKKIQPNIYRPHGPWAYPVYRILHNETAADIDVWYYKFDSTSVAWRATAQQLQIASFPACMVDYTPCAVDMIRRDTAFHLLDDLVEASKQSHFRSADLQPRTLVMRAKVLFADRIHDYLLPQIWNRPFASTVQSVYYPPTLLMQLPAFNVCGFAGHAPSFCRDYWPNYARFYCADDVKDPTEAATGQMAQDIRKRFKKRQAQYPNYVLDMAILSQAEVPQATIGGFQHSSVRVSDASTIIRVRDCRGSNCTTLLGDDYRYEVGTRIGNSDEIYCMVAMLRGFAQTYFVLRIVLLLIGAYVARRQEEHYADAPWYTVVCGAFRAVANIPGQGLVYGSPLPTFCYVLAHAIDSPIAYEILYEKFGTMLGANSHFSFLEICECSAVQMRNIWLLSGLLQVVVWMRSRHQWSPTRGIRGVPDFTLTVLSAGTLFASYRASGMRSMPVLEVMKIGESDHSGIASFSMFDSRGRDGNIIYRGIVLDVKCLLALVFVMVAVGIVVWVVAVLGTEKMRQHALAFTTTTPVPYSAGELWSTTAFCINWDCSAFVGNQAKWTDESRVATKARKYVNQLQRTLGCIRSGASSNKPGHSFDCATETVTHFHFLRSQFDAAHERLDAVHGMVALLNLFAVTDPWTLLQLRFGSGISVCYIQHVPSGHICCLPSATVERMQGNLSWNEMYVIRTDNTANMTWSDLLQCG